MLAEVVAQSRFIQKIAGIVGLTGTQLGSLRVAQVEGSGDEMTRAGLRYHLSAFGATGIASVVSVPSTAASWLLYNPLSNPVTALLDRVAVVSNTGTGGAPGGALYMAIVPPKFMPSTIPTASAANVEVQNANAVSAKQSSLVLAASQTLQNIAAGNWFPVPNAVSYSTTAQILDGGLLDSGMQLNGAFAVPPGCGIALATIMAVANAPLWAPVLSWREYTSDVE